MIFSKNPINKQTSPAVRKTVIEHAIYSTKRLPFRNKNFLFKWQRKWRNRKSGFNPRIIIFKSTKHFFVQRKSSNFLLDVSTSRKINAQGFSFFHQSAPAKKRIVFLKTNCQSHFHNQVQWRLL